MNNEEKVSLAIGYIYLLKNETYHVIEKEIKELQGQYLIYEMPIITVAEHDNNGMLFTDTTEKHNKYVADQIKELEIYQKQIEYFLKYMDATHPNIQENMRFWISYYGTVANMLDADWS